MGFSRSRNSTACWLRQAFSSTCHGRAARVRHFLQQRFPWSVAPSGEPGRYDLEIDRRARNRASQRPRAFGDRRIRGGRGRSPARAGHRGRDVSDRVRRRHHGRPRAAGRRHRRDFRPLSDGEFEEDTGSISGRVTKNGQGCSARTSSPSIPPPARWSGTSRSNELGRFSIAGLTPGLHVVRVEPVDDADVESFFESDPPPIMDFRAAFHDRLVGVPRGGDSGAIEIKVRREMSLVRRCDRRAACASADGGHRAVRKRTHPGDRSRRRRPVRSRPCRWARPMRTRPTREEADFRLFTSESSLRARSVSRGEIRRAGDAGHCAGRIGS